jgi:hypothetical protein
MNATIISGTQNNISQPRFCFRNNGLFTCDDSDSNRDSNGFEGMLVLWIIRLIKLRRMKWVVQAAHMC